jgi:single-strand DNA-binding protein
MNNLTVEGTIATPPSLDYHGPKQTPRVTFRLADRHSFPNGAGGWSDETSFHNVVMWRQLALNAASSFSLGDLVIVVGRLKTREYVSKHSDKAVWIEIEASSIGASVRFAVAVPVRNKLEERKP